MSAIDAGPGARAGSPRAGAPEVGSPQGGSRAGSPRASSQRLRRLAAVAAHVWRFTQAALAVPPRRRRLRLRSPRRAALLLVGMVVFGQAIIGAPAMAQLPIPGVEDCKESPNPERPGSGLVGVLDPTPLGQGADGSVYRDYGYAGQVWHTYDLGCGPSGLRNPNAVVDTWVGNQTFNIGKALVAATNGLHYALLDGGLMDPLDDLIQQGTSILYNSVYLELFGLVALFLAVVLFRSIWRGDLATIGKRTMWALVAVWFASLTYLMPLTYTQVLDGLLIDGTSAVQAGFLEDDDAQRGDRLPTLLHETVVYQNWKRGEFGSATAPQAEQQARPLVDAQAWTKQQLADAADGDSGQLDAKRQAYQDVAGNLGTSYGYFQGKDGSRMGAGFLAAAQAIALSLFQLLAKAAILLAQVLLRVLILVGPLVGLIAIVHNEVLRTVGRALGVLLINVIVIAAMAGLHGFVLTQLFDPANNIPPLAQLLLAAVITVIFLLIVKPARRMWQMMEMSVSAVGGALPASGPGVLSRLRKRKEQLPTPQDDFWAQVRTSESEPISPSAHDGRLRPEASPTVVAIAERLDRDAARRNQLSGGAPGAPLVITGMPVGSGPTRAEQRALPAGSSAGPPSRVVDTAPVVDRSWDDVNDEPVLVPSRAAAPPAPRRAEVEMVGGKAVHVLYRPSRGIEVQPASENRGGYLGRS